MSKRTLYLIALAALAGCNATMPQQQAQRPTSADDPSNMCYRTIPDNPRLAALQGKIPIGDPRKATLEMLSSTDRPTEEEKKALSIWAEHRAACSESGRNFRAQYAPPGWVNALEQGQIEIVQAIATLYGGGTYGQFNSERQRIGSRMLAALDASSRGAQQAEANQRANDQSAALQRLQMMQALQAMQPRPQPMPSLIQPTVNCVTRPMGATAYTTCN